jgi:hypothetical protein
MTNRIESQAALLVGVGLAVLALAGGCNPGDTSGFKPEQKLSKTQIRQRIEQLKSNPRVPEGIKATAMKKLEKDLQTAE